LTGLIQDFGRWSLAGAEPTVGGVPLIDRLSVNFSNTARARLHDLVGQFVGAAHTAQKLQDL